MAPSDVEAGSIQYAQDEPAPRPCFTRKKKVMMAVFNVAAVAVILGVFMSRSKTDVRSAYNLSGENPYGTEDVSAISGAVDESTDSDNSSTPKQPVTDIDSITAFNGPLPISSRTSDLYRITCDPNEVLTSLDLVTDGYAWETSWEIKRADGTQLAFGPPTGQKYQRMTSYKGEICLPVGRNVLVMYDSAGDGLCCVYGNGKMTIAANGNTLVETGDEDFKEQEYPFELFSNGDVVSSSTTSTDAATVGIDSVSSSTVAAAASTTVMESTSFAETSSTGMESTTTEVGSTSFAETTDITTSMATSSMAGSTSSSVMIATSTGLESTTTDIATTTTGSAVGDGEYCVTVEVLTDQFSKSETAYAFTSKPANKNEDPVVYISKAVGDLENEQLYSDTVCVPAGTYELYVEDSFRGLCCSGGKGYYAVKVDGEEILYGGSYANFPGDSVTHDIVLGEDFGTDDRAVEWLSVHNTRRQSHHEKEGTEYRPLVWSNTLENDARNWLQQIFKECKTVREQGVAEGENLSFRKVGNERDTEGPENMLKRWVDLKVNKSYPENASMTQALWRATRYVGCADGSKKMADGDICYASICRYARAGNCVMGKYDDWKEPTFADRTSCGPVCPDDGCH